MYETTKLITFVFYYGQSIERGQNISEDFRICSARLKDPFPQEEEYKIGGSLKNIYNFLQKSYSYEKKYKIFSFFTRRWILFLKSKVKLVKTTCVNRKGKVNVTRVFRGSISQKRYHVEAESFLKWCFLLFSQCFV